MPPLPRFFAERESNVRWQDRRKKLGERAGVRGSFEHAALHESPLIRPIGHLLPRGGEGTVSFDHLCRQTTLRRSETSNMKPSNWKSWCVLFLFRKQPTSIAGFRTFPAGRCLVSNLTILVLYKQRQQRCFLHLTRPSTKTQTLLKQGDRAVMANWQSPRILLIHP